MFLYNRHRRLRKNESIRSMIRENHLSPNDFILPIFMAEGEGVKEEIAAMPGIYRQSLDNTVKEVKEIWDLGIKSVNIYCKVSDNLKDNTGKEAWNPNGLMQNTIKAIKDAVIRLKERDFATKLARNARSHIEKSYTWQIAGERLIAAYTELGINKSMTV